MANQQYNNQKKPLKYSKNSIDKAAKEIRHGIQGAERQDAIVKIQSFREFHLYPLMLLKNHLARTSNKVSNKIIVARRLKRLSTIIDKLERPTLDGQGSNAIKLTRMQDIAGCRAIVKNLTQLKKLQRKLEQSRSVHQIINTKDYLTCPKKSGYGGIHLVYSCYEGQKEGHEWKKAKVEVQLRTELQHAWATSLEIIDTLEHTKLKTRTEGDQKWRRFFELAGKLVAHEEKACRIEDEKELLQLRVELSDLNDELEVIAKLARYSMAITFTTEKENPKPFKNGQGFFLTCIHKPVDGKPPTVSVEFFPLKLSDQALKKLNESDLDTTILVAVLVAASDVRALKQAYPNYFGSTRKFRDFLSKQNEAVYVARKKIQLELEIG
ncbi:RelA/SpoT domain-containing protein [Vibrio harveyi]|uniref:RelA/SpoT domain-containing protein n=1 Tax=Vibrio harveyi TaxID=669 RepID=UPI0002EB2ACA|nr:RelA/SpoT domain-containing protein [Vibrio harveyi]